MKASWGWMVALCAAIGCSSSDAPKTVPISGVVQVGGKPMPDVNVAFYPEKGRPATGRTGPDGRFKLTTSKPGDGAILGSHKIAVVADAGSSNAGIDPVNGPPQPGQPGYEAYMKGQAKVLDPRYSSPETSGLTMVVEEAADDVVLDLDPPGKR